MPKRPDRRDEKPSGNARSTRSAKAASDSGSESKAAADRLRMEKARRLARQIAADSRFARGAGPGQIAQARPVNPEAQKLASRVARILYTPITLDLVRSRDEKSAKGKTANGGKTPSREAAAAARAGRAARTGGEKSTGDDRAAFTGNDAWSDLMKDPDMAKLLEVSDQARVVESDEVEQEFDAVPSSGSKKGARPAPTGAGRAQPAPIEYRIPLGRTIARIVLYGICLAAIAGTYIFYREVISQQKTVVGIERPGLDSPGHMQPENQKPTDGEKSALSGSNTGAGKAEDEEMRGVEAAGRAHDVLKNTIFKR